MFKQKFATIALAGMVGLGFRFPNAGDIRDFFKRPQILPTQVENQIQNREENKIRTKEANRIFKFIDRRAVLGSAKVTAKGGTSLTVTQGDKTYTVLTSLTTQYRRKFWGTSSLNEISVGDIINVVGKWNNEERTEINALWIRNLSIQKRYGVFFGEVKSLPGGTFVMTTFKREDQTVTVGEAKLVNRKQEPITLSDILVGHKVRVKGMWDSVNHTITEVAQIKDFSLPAVEATVTPTLTP